MTRNDCKPLHPARFCRRLVHTLALIALAGCGLVLAAAGPALAQTGQPFIPHQSWYTDAFGVGVIADGVGGLQVETDGVPGISAADHGHAVPPEADGGLGAARNYRLSPSRRHLYVFGTTADATGARMYLYRVPAVDGAALEFIAASQTFPGGIAFEGFYDPGTPGEPALFFGVSVSGVWPLQRIWWVNLDNGVTGYTLDLYPSLQSPVHFAPNGLAAFVQHGTATQGQSTYRLIGLCDDGLGVPHNLAGAPFDNLPAPTAVAYLEGSAGSGFSAEVYHGGSLLDAVPVDDCSGAVTPDLGACCLAGQCLPGMTEAASLALGGVWQGPGSDCGSISCPPPPQAAFTLNVSGPAGIPALGQATYTLTVENTGNGTSEWAFLYASRPSGSTFVSASAPGVYDPAIARVTWSLGFLAPGDVVTKTMTVTVGCGVSQLFQTGSFVQAGSISATGGSVTTVVTQPTGTPNVSITAQASSLPLPPGGTIDYTFALTLPAGDDQPGVVFSGGYGDFVTFDGVIDNGGGVWQHNGTGFTWTGDVPGGTTTSVVVRVALPECYPTYPPYTTLNFGNSIQIFGSCGDILGQVAPPTPTPLTPPDIEMEIIPTGPVAPRMYGGIEPYNGAVVRPGVPFDVEWIIANTGANAHQVTEAYCSLQQLLPAADPPLVGTPPAGATWDGPNNRVVWAGALAPGDSVRVRFQAVCPPDPGCASSFWASLATADCASYNTASARVIGVEPAWTTDHLIFSNFPATLSRLRPGIDTEPQPWICVGGEYTSSVAQAPGGALWMIGLPNIRLDPATLEMWRFDYDYLQQLGLTTLWTVAEDSTGQVYLATAMNVGPDVRTSIVRWDPPTEATTLIWQEQTGSIGDVSSIGALVLGDDGTLAVSTPEGIVHIDLADPASAVIWHDPLLTRPYGPLTRLADRRYVTADQVWGSGVEVLAGIDPVSGSHSALVANLNGQPGFEFAPYAQLTGDSGLNVYLAPGYGRLAVVDLTAPNPQPTLLTLASDSYIGLLWRTGSGVTTPVGDLHLPPARLALHNAVPNPFNPRTTLAFDLPRAGTVRLDLFDVRGRRVAVLVDQELPAGTHRVVWEGLDEQGRAVPSGVYLARMQAAGLTRSVKIMLTR